MTVSDDTLLDAVETSLFMLPELTGRFDWLQIPGVRGRITETSHPVANLVGAATLTSDHADATIRQVYDLFAGHNKAFGWVVGPRSTPSDLANRLTGAGLAKVDELAGMVLTDLDAPIRTNPDVRVEEATPAETLQASDMFAHAYGMPEDVSRLFLEVYLQGGDRLKVRSYLAYVEGNDQPIGFSNVQYLPDEPIVLLGGAATLPEYRGRGIYTSFVARRLADARADGAEAAVIQAVRSTSAPICARLGFREIGELDLYAWLPK